MAAAAWRGWRTVVFLSALGIAGTGKLLPAASAQELLPASPPSPASSCAPPTPVPPPALAPEDKPLPINLPTALQLANVRPIDVAVASQRIRLAAGQLEQARVLWLPTVYLGIDYSRHDGEIQDSSGDVSSNSHSSFLLGAGPYAVFALSDAIFAPLAARQVIRARQAALQTARNDSLLAVAEAYFNVQQARGDLAGAEDVARRVEDLLRRTRGLVSGGVVPELEVLRARTAAAGIRQALQTSRERWRVASADLLRILRLDPSTVVEPLEPPHLRLTLVALDQPVEDLIRVGLSNRPELATQQALVQEALQRLRQERLRPLVPSILLRGASTPVTGTLAGGLFGGGVNANLDSFGARSDIDLQVLWEWRNLGFGNQALVQQRGAEKRLALLELFRTQDRVAAEVAQAYARARAAAARLGDAEAELRDAVASVTKNLQGLGQTRAAGNVLILVVRPQEVLAAIQALSQAYTDYYAAVADYDRAQFGLYHALGRPAQALAGEGPGCAASPGAAAVPGLQRPGPDGAEAGSARDGNGSPGPIRAPGR